MFDLSWNCCFCNIAKSVNMTHIKGHFVDMSKNSAKKTMTKAYVGG